MPWLPLAVVLVCGIACLVFLGNWRRASYYSGISQTWPDLIGAVGTGIAAVIAAVVALDEFLSPLKELLGGGGAVLAVLALVLVFSQR